jgi:hypothetical protein
MGGLVPTGGGQRGRRGVSAHGMLGSMTRGTQLAVEEGGRR